MRSTLQLLLFALAAILIASPAIAERQEKPNGDILMVGRCHTPAAAADILDRFAKTHNDRASWEKRRATIRQGILDGTQLSPLPKNRKAPAVIRHSKKQMLGYTVENIAIETLPGLWLCGNLYLPNHYNPDDAAAKLPGGIPGVLCPHGHKKDKRFDEQVQSRSAALARLGCAVFAYDMLGFGETTQLDHKIPQALRIQTWNSIRALDFVSALPGIDQDRLAITGGSGGGTQTFVLSAIDDRIDLAMPAVMVSAHFFGGCTCESAMPIHVHNKTHFETNNVEIAATFAPKPLLLISNGKDWTAQTPRDEFPYTQRIYSYYNAKENVENAHLQNEGHDYGPSKRAAAYRFLAKHFKLDLAPLQDDQGNIDESWLKPLDRQALSVFNDTHVLSGEARIKPTKIAQQLDALIAGE